MDEPKTPIAKRDSNVPSFIAEMDARMPSKSELATDFKPDVVVAKRNEVRYVPAHELTIPEGVDPHIWCRDRGIVPVRRYAVWSAKYPELAPVRGWGTGASSVITVFQERHRLKPEFAAMANIQAVEIDEQGEPITPDPDHDDALAGALASGR